MKKIILITTLIVAVSIIGCKTQEVPLKSGSLKETYKDYFLVGTTITPEIRKNSKLAKTILYHFDTVSFNNFTAREIHPEEGEYHFDGVEFLIEFTSQNRLQFTPGPLIDAEGNNLPSWFTKRCSPLVLKMRCIDHIFTVTTHFRHQSSQWIIVRAALAAPSSPDTYSKERILYKKGRGPKYIFDSFNEAKNNRYIKTKLYSDYDLCHPGKRIKAVKLIESLRRNGTPADGIVIEAFNWNTSSPSLSEIEDTIDTFSNLGLYVHFSEIEIEGEEKAVAKRYGEIFKIFRAKHRSIKSVSIGTENASQFLMKNGKPKQNLKQVLDF